MNTHLKLHKELCFNPNHKKLSNNQNQTLSDSTLKDQDQCNNSATFPNLSHKGPELKTLMSRDHTRNLIIQTTSQRNQLHRSWESTVKKTLTEQSCGDSRTTTEVSKRKLLELIASPEEFMGIGKAFSWALIKLLIVKLSAFYRYVDPDGEKRVCWCIILIKIYFLLSCLLSELNNVDNIPQEYKYETGILCKILLHSSKLTIIQFHTFLHEQATQTSEIRKMTKTLKLKTILLIWKLSSNLRDLNKASSNSFIEIKTWFKDKKLWCI